MLVVKTEDIQKWILKINRKFLLNGASPILPQQDDWLVNKNFFGHLPLTLLNRNGG
jgi:hypothetical protein